MRVEQSDQRGDTLIEVLLAIAVLGAIVTISLSVMNRGFGIAQNSLDRSNTQAIINGQAAILRSIHNRGDTELWLEVLKRVAASPADYVTTSGVASRNGIPGADGCSSGVTAPEKALFYFDSTSDTPLTPVSYYPLETFQANYLKRRGTTPAAGNGIWIEGYKEYSDKDFYVFYIKSCWDSVYGSSSVPNQSKTVVRLYAQ